MSKYYEVLVQLKMENDKGKIKNVKELYLVDAMSVTEAEAKVVETFTKSGFSQDYSVVSVKGSKVVDVITATDVPKNWKKVEPTQKLSEVDEVDED